MFGPCMEEKKAREREKRDKGGPWVSRIPSWAKPTQGRRRGEKRKREEAGPRLGFAHWSLP